MELTSLSKEIIKSQSGNKLTVVQTIGAGGITWEDGSDKLRNNIIKEVSVHILPKMELHHRNNGDFVAIKGQCYVFSVSEFEELVSSIEKKVVEELGPKIIWGDEGK